MSVIKLRLPKPLKNVEIIRSEDLNKFGAEDFYLDDFSKSNKDFPNISEKEPSPAKKPKLDKYPLFTHYYYFSCLSKPVQISLEKLPSEAISLDEVQTYIQEAYDRGFSEGQQVTKSDLQMEIEKNNEWMRRIDDVISQFRSEYTKQIKELNETLPELAIMIARELINSEISNNQQLVLEQVKKVIEELDDDKVFKIKVHPSNIELLSKAKSKLVTDESFLDEVEIVGDKSIDKMGCILETSAGKIDATLETQLKAYKRILERSLATDDFNEESIF